MEDIAVTFYHNVDPRRKQELADSRMVQENHMQMSNLDHNAIVREFNPDKYVERLSMFNQSSNKSRK